MKISQHQLEITTMSKNTKVISFCTLIRALLLYSTNLYLNRDHNSGSEVRPESMSSTRNILKRRISNVQAGIVRSRRKIMSMFHNQPSDEIELSGI